MSEGVSEGVSEWRLLHTGCAQWAIEYTRATAAARTVVPGTEGLKAESFRRELKADRIDWQHGKTRQTPRRVNMT